MYERKHGKHLPFIIAEIGINHNGDLEIAKKLIDLAVEHDCDAVKFQKRTIDTVYTQEYLAGQRESPWEPPRENKKKAWSLEKKNMMKSTHIASPWEFCGRHPPGTRKARSF